MKQKRNHIGHREAAERYDNREPGRLRTYALLVAKIKEPPAVWELCRSRARQRSRRGTGSGITLANATTQLAWEFSELAIAGAAYLIVRSTRGTAWTVVSCSAYGVGAGAFFVYLCLTLYHSLVRTRAQHVFQVLDHAAIYPADCQKTYTPFTLVSLHGRLGWAGAESGWCGDWRFQEWCSRCLALCQVCALRRR